MAKLTPLLEQYRRVKSLYRDAMLFFRLGDFYEMFFEDAIEGSKILGITLTSRNKEKGSEVPLCGVPYHAVDQYLAKLTKAGKKVAICEQMEDPAKAKGLVRREVVRVVTPGTTFSDSILTPEKNNFIAAIISVKGDYGLAWLDVTTGEFFVKDIRASELRGELSRIAPAELIVPRSTYETPGALAILRVGNQASITPWDDWHFEASESWDKLLSHFKVKTLDGFGLHERQLGIRPAGALMAYLEDTQKNGLEHLNSIKAEQPDNYLFLDDSAIRNLEILYNRQDFSSAHSLWSVFTAPQTSLGGRWLRFTLLHPLRDRLAIEQRYDAVDWFMENESLAEILSSISDLERLAGKLSYRSISPRELARIRLTLETIPRVVEFLKSATPPLLKQHRQSLLRHSASELLEYCKKALADDPGVSLIEGDVIRAGFSAELDEVRKMASGGRQNLTEMERRERVRTGIDNLKIKYNQIFGYYLEITNKHRNKVPSDYLRKQTLVNAERYITPELKNYEELVLRSAEQRLRIEQRLFDELCARALKEINSLRILSAALAELDGLTALAATAKQRNYIRPRLSDQKIIEIVKGRHPVLEISEGPDRYVPNDTKMDKDSYFQIITGPNMAGKSSYLRQVALIILMAQCGSFVPAHQATLGLVDRIFTRIGAGDDLSRGLSTFMVEMQETANIIHSATERSLIILDEVGRGTSTFDGVSIAWAIGEYLLERIKAHTLFATHYHQLIDLQNNYPAARNYSAAVKEHQGKVTFLYAIVPGGSDRSYGIHVAQIAGLPLPIIDRAGQILRQIENHDNAWQKDIKHRLISHNQTTLWRSKI